MVDITIYSKTGTEKAVVKTLEYEGQFMGDRYVTVSVESPIVINWQIGDYLDYRGERWKLWLLPKASKVARVRTYGAAIEYKDIRFCPNEEELRRCSFLDVVKDDNEIHYTSLPNFSFYCATAQYLADRIQANLDRLYPGEWDIDVNEGVTILDKSLSFSNNNCWDALVMANTELDLNFFVDSANKSIVIGGEGEYIETVMTYGKGNGLKSIERTVDDNQQVVNRLYAYGNTRNLPYRYYNKRYQEGSSVFDMVQSMYLPNLMLPGICKGWTASDAVNYLNEDGTIKSGHYGSEGQLLTYNSATHWFENPDGSEYEGTVYQYYKHYSLSEDETMYYCDRVWLESEDSIDKSGVQEGTKFFDGSDDLVEDIYPSITGFDSTEELATALGSTIATEQNLSYEQGALDEIIEAVVDVGDGIIPETEETTPTFYVRIKNIGFDLSDAELDASGDTPRLSMKSGSCTGREFNILSCKKQVYSNGAWVDYNSSSPVSGAWSYYLKCEVAADDSIGQYFPNDNFLLAAEDKFVILGIRMPDVYVDVAENRLLKAAIIWLSENDKTSFSYTPTINNIYMSENPETSSMLKEGNVLIVYDADLGIDIEMTISQLRIKNDKQIPEYEVTLSNDKDADLVQRVTAQVKQSYSQFGAGGNAGSGIYLIGMASNAAATDNNAFSARRSLNMFLRKDVADTAAGKITFSSGSDNKGNADFTDYRGFSGDWLGYGGRITNEGKATFEEVNVRGSLRAAELTFNLIDAEEGEAIRSIGHGEIESVTISNSTTGIATLKLDGDQWATIDVGDICRGMYNTIGKDYDNASSSGTDSNGFQNKKGFFASYFKVTSVTSSKGSCRFNYELQTSHGNPACEHPCPLMRFAVYGNTNSAKPERQSCMYISAVGISPRELYLAGVNTWAIKPENIKIASGNIEGLYVWNRVTQEEYDDSQATVGVGKKTWTVDGETYYAILEELHGDAGFYCEDNIYLGGVINQLKADAIDAVSASVTNLGQAWVWTNISEKFIDCDEDGYPLASTIVNISAKLYFGNNLCELDTDPSKCYIDGFMFSSREFNGDYEIYRNITVGTSSVLNSEMVRVFLTGTYNGNEYTAIKTVPVVANRQGVTGADGASVAYISSNEEYFTVECGSDGKALSSNSLSLTASLMVGNNAATLNRNDSYFGYGSIQTYPPTFSQDDTVASKTFTIASGDTPNSEITIVLKGTYGNNTYNLSKKIPIFAVKRGADGVDGDDGVGIASVATYYLLTTMYEGVTTSTTGWTTTYSEPNEALPYLWRYTLYTYDTDPVTTYATPCELIYTYNATPNPNLLDDTEFLGSSYMDAWDSIGVGVGTTGAAAPTISYNSVASLGHNRFGIAYNPRNTDGYIEYLYQSLYNTDNGVYKIEASTWYTLSFWLYSGTGYTQSDHWLDFNMNGLYDSTAGRYLDGVAYTSNQAVIHFSPTNSWVKHTVSFKTSSSLTSPVKFKLQMYSRTYNQNIQVCMPKLEVGRIATPYVSAKSVTEPMARTSTWEVGKQYYKGATGEPYMDIVAKNGKWYRCLRTHLSTNSNTPVDSTETAYWSPANNFDFIATDLLLADQAVINLMFSQKILMHNENNQLTASLNADGAGSYVIYYPESGNKMMEFSAEGYIKYFNDNGGNDLQWRLGFGGSILGHTSDDWKPLMLYKLPSDSVNFTSETTFNRTTYYEFSAGSSNNYADYDNAIYSQHNTDDPTNLTTNPAATTGWYTPDPAPWGKIDDDGENMIYSITMYRIVKSASTPKIAKITQKWIRYYDGTSYTNEQDS